MGDRIFGLIFGLIFDPMFDVMFDVMLFDPMFDPMFDSMFDSMFGANFDAMSDPGPCISSSPCCVNPADLPIRLIFPACRNPLAVTGRPQPRG
jgi:hypothetical protein